MILLQDYKNIPETAKNSVLVIGNFDGVHLGHRALLKRAKNLARETGAPLAVLTFEPHPRKLFRPDEPPNRITPAPVKHEKLQECGVDIIFSLTFDWDFASLSAEDFIKKILLNAIAPTHVFVGKDFRFGQLRKGNPDHLTQMGLDVTSIDKLAAQDGVTYSSSKIRQNLRHGKIEEANETLGWNWEIRGEVFKGDQRGRELGYPTANMSLGETVHPSYGIYAVFVQIEGEEKWHKGAANIGIRPMFKVETGQIETFIFDFDREIYGKSLRVRPLQRLRGEAKFDSIESLIAQMDKDCDQAREFLEKVEDI